MHIPDGLLDNTPMAGGAESVITVAEAEMAAVDQTVYAALDKAEATPAREAAHYHLATGGHRLRARLALASGTAWHTPVPHRIAAAAACELLHNASLIHDDLSDGDAMRRGHAAVWHRYGSDIALCAGDLLLTSAFQTAADIDNPAASQALVRQLAAHANRVIGGQSLELAARHDATMPTFVAYARATRDKTAPLIELPLKVGAIPDRIPSSLALLLRPLAEAIGLAYQILDDLDDCTDLTRHEKARTLHPLHAWHHHQPAGRTAVSPADIRSNCHRHVQAALVRAQRLSAAFPAPLGTELRTVIDQLSAKAERHVGAASTRPEEA